jgi:phage gp45-like
MIANLRAQVLQWAGRMVKMATLSSFSSKWGLGFVATCHPDETLGQQTAQQPVRFYQWQGFRVRPKIEGTQAVVLAPRAGSSGAVVVACDDLTTGPQPTDELEPVIYDGAGSTITFDKSGSVEINTASGAKALLDSDGNIWMIPKTGKRVNAGTGITAQLDKLVTHSELQTALDLVAGHVHPVSGASTGASPTLTPPALTINGSPNCYARKP